MNSKELRIRRLLFDLHISNRYRGYACVYEALLLLEEDEDLLVFISKGLYVDVAVRVGTTPACVERNIRTVKEKAFERNREHFLFSGCEECPSNGEFLGLLMYQLKLWDYQNRKFLRF
ncbi:MAG: hypothetical protein E7253_08815 [Lachnospiraceae bacterium]|nr:hypothetical protein [Lachnospiraceae bacterium]